MNPTPTTLIGTLRRAERSPLRRWHLLLGLVVLLIARAFLYWQIGAAVDWAPGLRLGAIAISFRSDFFPRMLFFSFLGFLETLVLFYLWLILLSIVNRRLLDLDPFQRLVRLHLGRLERLPWLLKIVVPLLFVAAAWFAVAPLLTRWEILPMIRIPAQRYEQAAIIAISAYLSLKYVFAAFVVLYVLNCYVYLGNHPVWAYVDATSHNLLKWICWGGFRIGKLDFAPILALALVFASAEFAEHGLTALYSRLMH
jgi:hypothetical protein